MALPPKIPTLISNQIETTRLVLRMPRHEDRDQFFDAVHESFDTHRYWLNWRGEKPTLNKIDEILANAIVSFKERRSLPYHVFLRENETFVGRAGFFVVDWGVPKFEVGYWCRQKLRGQGYLREAVQALVDYGHKELGAARIEIRTNSQNQEAQAFALKLGFSLDATLKNNERDLDGELVDTSIFSSLSK